MFVCERNTGYESGSLKAVLEEVDAANSVCVCERADRDYGWWTTNDVKIGMSTVARAALHGKTVRVLHDFVVAANFTRNRNRALSDQRREVLQELFVQLSRVRSHTKQSLDPLAIGKSTVSGKLGDDGKIMPDQNDDLYITLSMALYHCRLLEHNNMPNFDYRRLQRWSGAAPAPLPATAGLQSTVTKRRTAESHHPESKRPRAVASPTPTPV